MKKKHNIFKVKFCGENYEIYLVERKYRWNGALAVEACMADSDEPFGTLTVNLQDPRQLQKGNAFFNANYLGELLPQLVSLGVVKHAADGYTRQSGFVTYPLCEWDTDRFFVDGAQNR